ncbi:MAG: hypothetical protein ACRC7O_05380, partial [Fimbriiglobus sp.]
MDPLMKASLIGFLIGFCYLVLSVTRVHPPLTAKTLEYSSFFRAKAIFIGVVVPAAILSDLPVSTASSLVLGAFAVASIFMGFALFIQMFRSQVVLTDEGVSNIKCYCNPTFYPWAEIAQ